MFLRSRRNFLVKKNLIFNFFHCLKTFHRELQICFAPLISFNLCSLGYLILLSADTILNIYFKTMTEDDDKEVVASAYMNTADIMQDCGYMVLQPCKPSLFSQTFCGSFIIIVNFIFLFCLVTSCANHCFIVDTNARI